MRVSLSHRPVNPLSSKIDFTFYVEAGVCIGGWWCSLGNLDDRSARVSLERHCITAVDEFIDLVSLLHF